MDVYQRSYDEEHPLVCMDESSKQLTKEVRHPIGGHSGHVTYYDTEYERNGTANLFVFFNPVSGWRRIDVTHSRTAKDWAYQIKKLVDEDYPQAKRITLVMDNLNTHMGASLYKVFKPEEANRLLKKLEFHYTPKHGSWLNMAEIEFSILGRECLDRRIPDKETMTQEIAAWVDERNEKRGQMQWRFTTQDARTKLRHLYPVI